MFIHNYLNLTTSFRRYGNPRSGSEIVHHLVPLGPKIKDKDKLKEKNPASKEKKADERKYQPSGFKSEAHVHRSVFEEQSVIHPPVTDIVIRKKHNQLWYRIQEKRRLPHLDIYRNNNILPFSILIKSVQF